MGVWGAIGILLIGLGSGCTRVQIQNTIKEYRIIVRPGDKIRPRSYESGYGDMQQLDTAPNEGDTLMLIIRGRM
ncbi:MAG: hypothetical protein JXX29_17995 [Deltaproteobacteria bacterium]|nr:hypothetical protein [Deltaproteobacteria bacterium]MBN2673579.1 hypothetical protein [Deltaproteobacteria bacterium]